MIFEGMQPSIRSKIHLKFTVNAYLFKSLTKWTIAFRETDVTFLHHAPRIDINTCCYKSFNLSCSFPTLHAVLMQPWLFKEFFSSQFWKRFLSFFVIYCNFAIFSYSQQWKQRNIHSSPSQSRYTFHDAIAMSNQMGAVIEDFFNLCHCHAVLKIRKKSKVFFKEMIKMFLRTSISCLLANTNNGTPSRREFCIIFTERTWKLFVDMTW